MACRYCAPTPTKRTIGFDLFLGVNPTNGVPIIAEGATGVGATEADALADAIAKQAEPNMPAGVPRLATGDEWERYAAYWNAKDDVEEAATSR